jgi:hypothetical protein
MNVRCRQSSRRRSQRGQSLVEYVLMLAMVSVLTAGFVRFLNQGVFKEGLNRLPDKAAPCLSHPTQPGPNQCR